MVDIKPEQIFSLLESTNPEEVKETKNAIQETLSSIRDSWLVAGLFEYYVKHGSLSCSEVLVVVRDPHDKHLLDKINEAIKGGVSASRMSGLTLLSYLIRRTPTWSFRIAKHSLLKDLIRLLKSDNDVSTVVCGVLLVVCLLPAIPAQISPHLNDIFFIFCRMATWCSSKKTTLGESNLLQLQVALYSLFHRLYAMFPCNFLAYLRKHYSSVENHIVFKRVIEPMLRLVRMHPNLVIASKDGETQSVRWKSMETHDIMAECSSVSLDPLEGTSEEMLVRTSAPSHHCENALAEPDEISDGLLAQIAAECLTMWSPVYNATTPVPSISERPRSEPAGMPQDLSGSSRMTPSSQQQAITSSIRKSFIEAFGARTTTGAKPTTATTTTSDSLPTSPSKVPERRDSCPAIERGVSRLLSERNEFLNSKPATFGVTGLLSSDKTLLHRPTPKKAQLDMSKVEEDVAESSGEDKEVIEIVDTMVKPRVLTMSRAGEEEEDRGRCDSVIKDYPSQPLISDVPEENRSHSQYLALLHRVTRFRYHSICVASEHRTVENGDGTEVSGGEQNGTVGSERRRSFSCPSSSQEKELIRSSTNPLKDGHTCPENCQVEHGTNDRSEGAEAKLIEKAKCYQSHGTQTEDEQGGAQYLLHMAFPPPPPSKCIQCRKNSDMAVGYVEPSPYKLCEDYIRNSLYLQKIKSKKPTGKETLESALVYAIQLQLSYERHKREQHEERNRRLAAKIRQGLAYYHKHQKLEEKVTREETRTKQINKDGDLLREENARLREEREHLRKQKETECGRLLRDNTRLQEENDRLRKLVQKAEEEQKCFNKSLSKAEAIVHDSHNELEKLYEKVSSKDELSRELTKLRKRVLVLFDINERFRAKMDSQQMTSHQEEEMRQLRHSATGQMKGLQNAIESRSQLIEAQKQRLQDYENQLNQKDTAIAKLKGSLIESEQVHTIRVEALQHKYNAIKAINKALEQSLLQHNLHRDPYTRPRGHSQPVDIPVSKTEPSTFQSLQDLVTDAESQESFHKT